jgi:DNA primase
VADHARSFLQEEGLMGFPKLSGSKGIHIHVPIAEGRYPFRLVRHACLAFARELSRRHPDDVTAAWWKEERGPRVFIDFNQNLRDKTVVAAYAVRPYPHAPVACPFTWDELATIDQRELTLATVPARIADHGDPMAALDDAQGASLDGLIDRHERDLAGGLPDAPYPPHYPKQPGEPTRVAPSRAKKR